MSRMPQSKGQIKTAEQALVYMTDCSLATVSSMAMKKSRPKGEYQRQILIAQAGVDWIRAFGIDARGTRIARIKTTVEEWVKRYYERNK